MPCPFLIVSQSDYLIQIVDINSHNEWLTVQIQISWLLKMPTDLDLHCLQRQDISGFSRTRVNSGVVLTLKMPRKPAYENVICFCRLLNILANFSNLFLHTGKQCGYRSDCSQRSSLIEVHSVCKNDF